MDIEHPAAKMIVEISKTVDDEETLKKIAASGANVVFCQKGIEELVQHYLAKAGILAAKRMKKSGRSAMIR